MVGNNKEIKLSDFYKTYHKAITLVKKQVEEIILGLKPSFNINIIRDNLNYRKAG
jgi:hypothetical protein